jgi:deoxyadenosine/deoxycytidine kinase
MRISVEGNIGSGKSSLLDELEGMLGPNVECIPEPVDALWTPYLDLFYRDPPRWGFLMQSMVLCTMAVRRPDPGVLLYERSPLSSKWVFERLLLERCIMTQEEGAVYDAMYGHMGWAPDAVVYVKTPAATCMERVTQRCRATEQRDSLDLEYLEVVGAHHESLVRSLCGTTPLLELDGSLMRPAEQAVLVRDWISGLLG